MQSAFTGGAYTELSIGGFGKMVTSYLMQNFLQKIYPTTKAQAIFMQKQSEIHSDRQPRALQLQIQAF